MFNSNDSVSRLSTLATPSDPHSANTPRRFGVRRTAAHTSRPLEVLYETKSNPDADKDIPPGRRKSNHTVDIVAVHGLGSDAERAWVHRTTGRSWLREFLPDDLGQRRARIMTYKHDSRWQSYTLRKSFDGFAKDLLEAITAARSSPEVWHGPWSALQ